MVSAWADDAAAIKAIDRAKNAEYGRDCMERFGLSWFGAQGLLEGTR
jgi:hypothetical protein